MKRHDKLSQEKLNQQVRPVAKALVSQFRGMVKKRNTFLPVAMDIRFEGKQGDVRIAFELYQCNSGVWHRIDRWEPMMAVMGSRLPENYTYTIHGMGGGETAREFYRRLGEDISWLLGEAVRYRAPALESEPEPVKMFDIPDTLSGMEPVSESQDLRI